MPQKPHTDIFRKVLAVFLKQNHMHIPWPMHPECEIELYVSRLTRAGHECQLGMVAKHAFQPVFGAHTREPALEGCVNRRKRNQRYVVERQEACGSALGA